MTTNLQESYRLCARITRTSARNFYYGISMLPPEKRRSMCAVYAFMRSCDDVADDEAAADRASGLRLWRERLDAVLRGDSDGSPLLPALHDAVERHRIPGEYLHALIDGAGMDLSVDRYATFDDLYPYCYRVASVVGLVCLHIFGFDDPKARTHAEECGIAFQLTNILRDVREDAGRGRIYLPQEDLARFGCPESDILNGVRSEAFRSLMAFQVERARRYYRSARALPPLIEPESRPCLVTMIGIYQGVLDRIEAGGFDPTRRARLSAVRKVSIAGRAWWACRRGREKEPSHA